MPIDDLVTKIAQELPARFETLPFDPRRSMIVRITDLERSGFGGGA